MGMSIKQLRAFLAVAHTLNFAHANERLNMSRPALSLAIKGLEDSLGGALLLRMTRKVALTQKGETLLNMGRQLLADWKNTEEAMHQRFTLQRGKISIAAMPSFAASVLPPVLKASCDSYSGINVTAYDTINEHVIEMVSEGRAEMGIAFEPDYSGHLHFTPLGADRFIAIVLSTCRLADRDRIAWRELLTLDLITLQHPSVAQLMLEEQLAQSGHTLEVALESHQLIIIGRLVTSGLGGSAVSALYRMQMTELGITYIDLDTPVIQRRTRVLCPAYHKLSTVSEVLVDSLKKAYHTWLLLTALVM